MISVLTMVFAQYMRTPFEMFTDKYIMGRGIFELLEKSTLEKRKSEYNEILQIEKFTHPDVKVSLYKLDRDINPTKGDFKTVAQKFTYFQETPSKPTITLNDSQIQNYLCIAIRRVHEIIMKIMKDYKVEHSMVEGEDDSDEINDLMKITQ